MLFGMTAPVSAQTPPYTAYGLDQRPGTVIAASIGGRSCGPGVTVDTLGRWVLRIATTDPCAPKEGDTISFSMSGTTAVQTVRWTAGGGPANAANGIALTPTAGATTGTFSGGSISPSGLSIVSFTGTTAQLNSAGASAKVSAVTATTGGRMLTYVIGAPSFVNADFEAAFPSGLTGTLVIVKGGGTSSGVVTPSTPPPPTPPASTTTVGGCPSDSRPVTALQAVTQVFTSSGSGTAFHIGSGEWLTAAHVVEQDRTVRLSSTTFDASATVVGLDVARDLALLRTSSAPTEALALIDVSTLDSGIGLAPI